MKKFTLFMLAVFLACACFDAFAVAREAYTEEEIDESGKLRGEMGENGRIVKLGEPTPEETAEADREEHRRSTDENTKPEFGAPDPAGTGAEIDF